MSAHTIRRRRRAPRARLGSREDGETVRARGLDRLRPASEDVPPSPSARSVALGPALTCPAAIAGRDERVTDAPREWTPGAAKRDIQKACRSGVPRTFDRRARSLLAERGREVGADPGDCASSLAEGRRPMSAPAPFAPERQARCRPLHGARSPSGLERLPDNLIQSVRLEERLQVFNARVAVGSE